MIRKTFISRRCCKMRVDGLPALTPENSSSFGPSPRARARSRARWSLNSQKIASRCAGCPAVRDRTGRGEKANVEDALLRPADGLVPVCGVTRDGPIVKLIAEAKIEPEVLGAFFQNLTL